MQCTTHFFVWSQFEFHSPEPRPVVGARGRRNDRSVASLVGDYQLSMGDIGFLICHHY